MTEMYDNAQRSEAFKKSEAVESSLAELNALIEPIHVDCSSVASSPIVLIMGCARAGSTLVMQYLSSLGVFSYPSNLIARFYRNPHIGILAQKALFDDAISSQGNQFTSAFNSELGRTKGLLEPSEFWYFWRQYFHFGEIERLTDAELATVKHAEFMNKLLSFPMLTGNPLALKGMMLNNHIPYLYATNPRFIFLHVQRSTAYNAQSLLMAREKFFGTREKWYSFKPVEYPAIKDCDPLEQVVRQVVYCNRAVVEGCRSVPCSNKVHLSYEEFCREPGSLLAKLTGTILSQAIPNLEKVNSSFTSFPPQNSIRMAPDEFTCLSATADRVERES